jgi:hypothetical protein
MDVDTTYIVSWKNAKGVEFDSMAKGLVEQRKAVQEASRDVSGFIRISILSGGELKLAHIVIEGVLYNCGEVIKLPS